MKYLSFTCIMLAQASPVHVRAAAGSANIPATIAKNLAYSDRFCLTSG